MYFRRYMMRPSPWCHWQTSFHHTPSTSAKWFPTYLRVLSITKEFSSSSSPSSPLINHWQGPVISALDPHSSTWSDFPSESLMIDYHSWQESGVGRDRRPVTINTLPDDVLVEIFNFHQDIDDPHRDFWRNTWPTLVHVCHRWRRLVFASPRRLNLRLEYRGQRPLSELLDAWPVLPVSLISINSSNNKSWENMVAALESEQSNRICEISIMISMTDSRWERFTEAMQKPFPKLTHLQVWTPDEVPVLLPDSFVGGSAPGLRSLFLGKIPFPSVPKLLLSAQGLVRLELWDIPDSGYFSPDALATALAVMTSLEILDLQLGSPPSRPDPASRLLPPPTRFVLPAFTELIFKGAYEYLEDLLARIDPPLLHNLYITFFMDLDFDVPQLHRLVGHAEEFKTLDRADMLIHDRYIRLGLNSNIDDRRPLDLRINCRQLDYQLLSLAQVCTSSFPTISALEELQIREHGWLSSSHWKDDMENAQWLELLDSFTALKNLYLTDGIAHRFCGALQELSGERTTEVLPALRNLFVRGSSLEPVQEAIKSFATARQLSGHPVVVNHWKD